MLDGRLGQKVQVLRTLRVLEKEGELQKDLKTIKSDIVFALGAGEVETRLALKELQPTLRTDGDLSDDLRSGLQWEREKMLRRIEEVEQSPPEHREQALRRFKDRLQKLSEKL